MTARRSTTEARRGGPIVWGILSVAIIVALVLLVLSVLDWAAEDPQSPDTHLGVAAGEVIENPDEYRSELITVSGEVNQVLGTFTYTIGGEQFTGGRELLIIGPPPPVGEDPQVEEETVQEQDIVQVRGTVRDFDLQEIEDEIGAEIDADIPEGLQDQPVVMAEGTVITPRVQTAQGEIAAIDDILDDPDEYVGSLVTIEGEVTEVVSEAAFVVDGLLVIDTTETITEQALEEAESIDASGVVMLFDLEEVEPEAGLTLEDGQFEQYQDEPVLIADSILILPDS